jgi:NitT/TauT family transport system permease protein
VTVVDKTEGAPVLPAIGAGKEPSPFKIRAQRTARQWAGLLLTVVVLVALWQLLIFVWRPPVVVLPGPAQVASEFADSWSLLLDNSWPTLFEGTAGFVMSLVIGIPLGTLLSRPYRICRALEPFMLITQVFPKIAVAPLFIIWFGFGFTPIILFVFLLTFFPIVLNTIDGYRSLPRDLRDLGDVIGMRSWRRLLTIELPYALPQIFTGMKVAASFGITAAIVYEFIGANAGLGFVISSAQANLATPLMFAGLILVAIIGFLFYGVVTLVETIAIPWHISQRSK